MKLPHRNLGTALAAATLCAATLTACHTLPALHYYALEPVRPNAAADHVGFPLLIHVRRISLPHEMDHLGLTHHLGPTQLAISDTDQWSAPLDVLIQGTLTADLGERLGYGHVIGADALPVTSQPRAGAGRDPQDTRGEVPATLDLDFVALAADATCGITAQVNWTLSVPDRPAQRGTAHLMTTAETCPGGLPAALSTALGDLADQMARALTAT